MNIEEVKVDKDDEFVDEHYSAIGSKSMKYPRTKLDVFGGMFINPEKADPSNNTFKLDKKNKFGLDQTDDDDSSSDEIIRQ